MGFHSSGMKAVSAAGLGSTPKRCELQLFFAGIWQAIQYVLESYPSQTLKYAVTAGLAKRWKNYNSFNFLGENLEKFRSTEHYGAALEGSTIFLCRSSLCSTSIESCQLAELKYAIFSRTGCKTKKLRRSKLLLLTVFKHGLLERSTILLQYSAITHTPLESSQIGELKYAISPG